jgi:16S rRNA (cytosine1402-N4)-methyltransferase
MSASPPDADAGLHAPVLYQEVLAALQPCAGGRYIDGTLGAGGHAAAILQASAPDGMLLGLDRDPSALEVASGRLAGFGCRTILRQASFAEMSRVAQTLGWSEVQGVLLDLGLSSMQLADAARGFSFQLEGPLDMRFDPSAPTTAAELVNTLDERALFELLRDLGEEPRARQVAHAIVQARPLRSTRQLAELAAASAFRVRGGIHPATRTFQALRMAVNGELEALEAGLQQAMMLLAPGARLAVIAFHSLEDRLVKTAFKAAAAPAAGAPGGVNLRILTRRPVRPSEAEIVRNPRARSARLRLVERAGAA